MGVSRGCLKVVVIDVTDFGIGVVLETMLVIVLYKEFRRLFVLVDKLTLLRRIALEKIVQRAGLYFIIITFIVIDVAATRNFIAYWDLRLHDHLDCPTEKALQQRRHESHHNVLVFLHFG